jgi:hypothetical protein
MKKDSKKQCDEENDFIKDVILQEYDEGNIVVSCFDGLKKMELSEFIKQPVDGLLYDLNRCESVVLTFIKDKKWMNDYAVAKVIRALKKRIDELEN